MRSLKIAAVLVLCVCGKVSAQDQQSLAAAQELVKLTSDQMMNDMIASMLEPFWKSIEPGLKSKANAQALSEIRQELTRIMQKYLSTAMTQAPAIYARHFTASEIQEIISFYKTAVGRKALQELPKVMGEFTAAAILPMMQPMQAELQTSILYVLRKHNIEP